MKSMHELLIPKIAGKEFGAVFWTAWRCRITLYHFYRRYCIWSGNLDRVTFEKTNSMIFSKKSKRKNISKIKNDIVAPFKSYNFFCLMSGRKNNLEFSLFAFLFDFNLFWICVEKSKRCPHEKNEFGPRPDRVKTHSNLPGEMVIY